MRIPAITAADHAFCTVIGMPCMWWLIKIVQVEVRSYAVQHHHRVCVVRDALLTTLAIARQQLTTSS
jgi:hypothetical protein